MSGDPFWTCLLARGQFPTRHHVEGKFGLERETLKVRKNRIDSIQPNPNKEEGNFNQVIHHDACTNLRFLLTVHNDTTLNFTT